MANFPIPFDEHHDGALLSAAGYVREFLPADWYDIGGPESGPKISGHPDMVIWSLSLNAHTDHIIVVVAGEIVESEYTPAAPPGWFDDGDCPPVTEDNYRGN